MKNYISKSILIVIIIAIIYGISFGLYSFGYLYNPFSRMSTLEAVVKRNLGFKEMTWGYNVETVNSLATATTEKDIDLLIQMVFSSNHINKGTAMSVLVMKYSKQSMQFFLNEYIKSNPKSCKISSEVLSILNSQSHRFHQEIKAFLKKHQIIAEKRTHFIPKTAAGTSASYPIYEFANISLYCQNDSLAKSLYEPS